MRTTLILLMVCMLPLCLGCSFDLFWVEVEVVPVQPTVTVRAETETQVKAQSRTFVDIVKAFFTLYPAKKGRLATIDANKANGFGVKYVKRWGFFHVKK